MKAISKYLNNPGITILSGDFADAVSSAKSGDFVYFDPPYDSEYETNFTGYQKGGFDHKQQERLRDLALELTERHVKCLLSNANTRYIRDIFDYDCFEIEKIAVNRFIGSNVNSRGLVDEVLIKNY